MDADGDNDCLVVTVGFRSHRLRHVKDDDGVFKPRFDRPLMLQFHGVGQRGEKSPERFVQRNGYRDRDWETRAGTVELRIPKHASGATSPASWSPAG